MDYSRFWGKTSWRRVTLNETSNQLSQKWSFKKNEFINMAKSSLRLDVFSSNTYNGAEVIIYGEKILNGMNQIWDLVFEEPHTCKIFSKNCKRLDWCTMIISIQK